MKTPVTQRVTPLGENLPGWIYPLSQGENKWSPFQIKLFGLVIRPLGAVNNPSNPGFKKVVPHWINRERVPQGFPKSLGTPHHKIRFKLKVFSGINGL